MYIYNNTHVCKTYPCKYHVHMKNMPCCQSKPHGVRRSSCPFLPLAARSGRLSCYIRQKGGRGKLVVSIISVCLGNLSPGHGKLIVSIISVWLGNVWPQGVQRCGLVKEKGSPSRRAVLSQQVQGVDHSHGRPWFNEAFEDNLQERALLCPILMDEVPVSTCKSCCTYFKPQINSSKARALRSDIMHSAT